MSGCSISLAMRSTPMSRRITHLERWGLSAAHDFTTIEPEILDEDMTPGDLVFALEHLHFNRNALGSLRIDRGTFIADLLKSRRRLEVENLFLRHQLITRHSAQARRDLQPQGP
jgi:hypothetical protein